jgi:hypothetical protein
MRVVGDGWEVPCPLYSLQLACYGCACGSLEKKGWELRSTLGCVDRVLVVPRRLEKPMLIL